MLQSLITVVIIQQGMSLSHHHWALLCSHFVSWQPYHIRQFINHSLLIQRHFYSFNDSVKMWWKCNANSLCFTLTNIKIYNTVFKIHYINMLISVYYIYILTSYMHTFFATFLFIVVWNVHSQYQCPNFTLDICHSIAWNRHWENENIENCQINGTNHCLDSILVRCIHHGLSLIPQVRPFLSSSTICLEQPFCRFKIHSSI